MGGGQFRGDSSVEMLACLPELGLGRNNYAEANGSRGLQIVWDLLSGISEKLWGQTAAASWLSQQGH